MTFWDYILWIWLVGMVVAIPALSLAVKRYDDIADTEDRWLLALLVVLCAPCWPFCVPIAWSAAILKDETADD